MISPEGDRRIYADTAAELLNMLIPGHHADGHRSRVHHARTIRAHVQTAAVQQIRGPIHQDAIAVLFRGAPHPDFWDHPAPLVLIDVDYHPYRDRHAPLTPDGDVADPATLWWLRTATPEDYLESLHRVGWITVNRHTSTSR
jgi:hypothetical protein